MSSTNDDIMFSADDDHYFTVNNGFWDLSPEERAARYERACERGGVESFWDLSPEERGRAYEDRDR